MILEEEAGMTRNRKLTAVLLAGAVAVAAYFVINQSVLTAATGYSDKNVNFGAVDAAAADAACGSSAGHERLICLADALKQTLSPELSARLQLAYSVDSAKKWSNFPPVGYPDRVGPTLADFTPEQLGYVKALLKTAAGIAAGEGYDELEQILNADDYLKAKTSDSAGFSSGNFHIAFLGSPAPTGTWELYFGGHHTALGVTYKDGKLIGATPSFRGVEPFTTFQQNGRDNAPMAEEQAAFTAMLGALSADEAGKAKLAQSYTNIIAGPQQDNSFPAEREGLRAAELSADKQALVMSAIGTYVRDINPPGADAIMAKYQSELADTFVAYSGTTGGNAENDYVRIDGPSVWIEWSVQPGRSIPGVHPHSVWRDKTADYGGNK